MQPSFGRYAGENRFLLHRRLECRQLAVGIPSLSGESKPKIVDP